MKTEMRTNMKHRRVENEDREEDVRLLQALESFSVVAIGGNWGTLVSPELVANLGRYRRCVHRSQRLCLYMKKV